MLFRCLPLFLFPAMALFAAPVTLPLWPEGVPQLKSGLPAETLVDERIQYVTTPTLTVYPAPAERANGAAVVICPGGGYRILSWEKEGVEIARWLNGLGVTAFVLKNRLGDYGHPAPLQDAVRAMRLVRAKADEFKIDPARLGILGFSAGGHLAASTGTLYDSADARTGDPLDSVSARPDFLILIYAVLTLDGPSAHRGSGDQLLGASADEARRAQFSPWRHVTPSTPPTFLLASSEDRTVPSENSIFFYQALREAKVAAELHVFARGPHGHGMRRGHGPVDDWPDLCNAWLVDQGWLRPRPPAASAP